MKLKDFRAMTDGLDEELEIEIHIEKRDQVGPTPTVRIKSILRGIDWDTNKLIVHTDKSICEEQFMWEGINIKQLMWASSNEVYTAVFDTTRSGRLSTNYGYNTVEFKLDREGNIKTARGRAKYTIEPIPDYVKCELKKVMKALNSDMSKLVFTEAIWGVSDGIRKCIGNSLSVSEININKRYIINTRKKV